MAANTLGAGPVPLTNGQVTTGLWDTDGYYLVAGQFTYSVPDATSSWSGYGSGDEPYTGYTPFDAQQASQFRAAIALWDSYIAPSFIQTDDHANTGFIRAAFTTATDDGTDDFAAYTYTGGSAGRQSPVAGDIWINATYNKPAETTFAVGTYDWETLLHEIGHAIGLKHPFEEPQIPADYEDRRYSIMSYTDYQDQYLVTFTTTATTIQGHYTAIEPSTPMVLDIAAVQARYGADPNTASGDTVYRFDQGSAFMQSIYDAGGKDTIDLSNFTRGSVVDLRPGAYSSIGYWSRADQEAYWIGQLGSQAADYVRRVFDDETYIWSNNLGLSFSTTIEDAVGGSGADTLVGNAVANVLTGGAGDDILTGGAGADLLTGGAGTDTFRDTTAGFAGDRITDFAAGERINVGDASQASFAYHRLGSTVDLGGGSSLSITGGITGYLVTRAGGAGGVDLTVKASPAGLNDFNGDGHSDILWQNRASGDFSAWQVTGNLSTTQVQQNSYYHGNVGAGWQIEGTIDYNGDGTSDMLWHNTLSGSISLWNATGSGGFSPGSYTSGGVDVSWSVAALGDFTGDGREELLWRNASGAVSEWQSTGSGFTANTFFANVDRTWHIQGTGDLDGDGRADIFWRNADGAVAVWTSTGSGMNTNSYYHGAIATSWHMTGIGDFDGDGRSDILWRNDDGSLSIWRSTGAGFTESVYNTNVPAAWHVVDVADYNGDGRDDILWRNDDGGLSIWRSTGGDFDKGVYNVGVGNEWQTLSHHYDII